MHIDKVERYWTVTLKVDVQSFNDCDIYRVQSWRLKYDVDVCQVFMLDCEVECCD